MTLFSSTFLTCCLKLIIQKTYISKYTANSKYYFSNNKSLFDKSTLVHNFFLPEFTSV